MRPPSRKARFAQFWSRWQSLIRLVLGLVVVGLGFWGWALQLPPKGWDGWINNLFRTAQLLILQFPQQIDGALVWQLQVARFLLPTMAALASFSVVLAAVRSPIRLALAGFWRDHIVMTLGSGGAADDLLARLRERGERCVVIGAGLADERVARLEADGVVVLAGDPQAGDSYRKAHAERAAAVLIAHGSDIENLNAAVAAADGMWRDGTVAPEGKLVVLVDDDALAELVDATLDSASRGTQLRIRRLSRGDELARAALLEPPLAAAKPNRGCPAHVLILGGGSAARELIRCLLTLGQDAPDAGPSITWLASADQIAAERLAGPDAVPAALATLRVIVLPAPVLDWPGHIVDALRDQPAPGRAFVCLPDNEALAVGLALSGLASRQGWPPMAILIHQSREDRFVAAIADADIRHGDTTGLRPFGGILPARVVTRLLDAGGDRLAIALHAHYLGGTAGAGNDPEHGWDALPENLRHANREAAEHIEIKLRSIGCRSVQGTAAGATLDDAEIETLAAIEHRRWWAERLLRGWRRGAVRDDRLRLHPDMRPYADLDEAARNKNRDAVRALPAILALARRRIVRDLAVSVEAAEARDIAGRLGAVRGIAAANPDRQVVPTLRLAHAADAVPLAAFVAAWAEPYDLVLPRLLVELLGDPDMAVRAALRRLATDAERVMVAAPLLPRAEQ